MPNYKEKLIEDGPLDIAERGAQIGRDWFDRLLEKDLLTITKKYARKDKREAEG